MAEAAMGALRRTKPLKNKGLGGIIQQNQGAVPKLTYWLKPRHS